MEIAVLQHVPFEGPGRIAAWAESRGHTLKAVHLHAGDVLPSADDVRGLVVMGGPMSVHDEDAHPWLADETSLIAEAVERAVPTLGVCLGAQLITKALGAAVSPGPQPEHGFAPITPTDAGAQHPLFAGSREPIEVFHWHGERCALPAGATLLASTEVCPVQAFAVGGRCLALQFHIETSRESAAALLEHCSGELVAGCATSQSGEAMLADPERFVRLSPVLDRTMDALFG